MITGDSPETALAVAQSVGIARAADTAVTGAQLDAMTDAQLAAACKTARVFARVSPAHKLRIVRAFKQAGNITAMTGDGVNDAPAVKEADIGVAMGISGTDVTKEASAVVILDDNFATIVAAVEEGRVIYQNIRRFIRYLLTSNLGEVLGMLFGMLMHLPVMLAPIQILLVNLFTDGLPLRLAWSRPQRTSWRARRGPRQRGCSRMGWRSPLQCAGPCWALPAPGPIRLRCAWAKALPRRARPAFSPLSCRRCCISSNAAARAFISAATAR